MSQIRKNIAANYAGSFWTAIMGLIFIPFYIKFMGIESYALIGLFASLLALFSILDMGLGATMTREMARLSALDPTGRETRGLARTLEVIYWSVALLLGLAVILLAGPIAEHWVKPDRLEPAVVKQAFMITGGVVVLRWPVSFYSGGLRGLDCQPLLNLIQSACATLRGLGAVMVLWLISPTIHAYFSYQIVISAVETFCLAGALWRSMPGRGTGVSFAWAPLRQVWRFSAGMTGISVVVLLLTQTDKIILSKMLSLELFGYYMLAWTVTATLVRIMEPIDSAVYPTLTRLVAEKNEQELRKLYHKSCQMQIALLVPASLILILFGDAVLVVWSGDPAIVHNTGPLLSALAIGTCLNGFIHIPYYTQLAYGWTSLTFYQFLISLIILIPLMVLFTHLWGGIGAAYVWVILNSGYLLIAIQIMHRRILTQEKWDWYIHDVGLPSMATLITALACRMIMPQGLPAFWLALYLAIVGGLCFLAAVCVAPSLRAGLMRASINLFRKTDPRTS
ncbi:MAG: lipopolysaccharide biosynthesis protein [Desulfomonilaceae bacterium]